MKGAYEHMGLTARSYDRILRVARTIADLDGDQPLQPHHLAEAIQYRQSDYSSRLRAGRQPNHERKLSTMSYVPSAPPVGDEIFLLKMGEMVLKGLNRRTFEERLMGNARRRLQKYGKFRIYSRQSITYVEPKEAGCDMDEAFATLSRLFGVVGLSRAKACEKAPEAILETAKTYLHDDLMAARTFKVESSGRTRPSP